MGAEAKNGRESINDWILTLKIRDNCGDDWPSGKDGYCEQNQLPFVDFGDRKIVFFNPARPVDPAVDEVSGRDDHDSSFSQMPSNDIEIVGVGYGPNETNWKVINALYEHKVDADNPTSEPYAFNDAIGVGGDEREGVADTPERITLGKNTDNIRSESNQQRDDCLLFGHELVCTRAKRSFAERPVNLEKGPCHKVFVSYLIS